MSEFKILNLGNYKPSDEDKYWDSLLGGKCSGLVNGRPCTVYDKELFTDMSEQDQQNVKRWIAKHLKKIKTASAFGLSSYWLKHELEADTGIYMTNNQFKDAMLLLGYKPYSVHEASWSFNVRRK